MTGGFGIDRFVFRGLSGEDVFTDFAQGHDRLAIDVVGIDDFGDLAIFNAGGDALIAWLAQGSVFTSVRLAGFDPAQL